MYVSTDSSKLPSSMGNDLCADLEPMHSGFSAAARPIPVILHGNQSISMIPVMIPFFTEPAESELIDCRVP